MKSNQITTRELFASNSSSECREYSENFSQLQNSQYDLSQEFVNSGGSQNDSQGRSLYERYMAAGPLFRSNNSHSKTAQKIPTTLAHPPSKPLPNFTQNIQLNKAKAKERDERDLLKSIVTMVKECSEEMKQTLNSVKENLNQHLESSEGQASDMVNIVMEGLQGNCQKILTAVQDRDDRRGKIQNLEKEIIKKDSKIEELQCRLETLQSQEDDRIVEALKSTLVEQQTLTEQKLQKLLDISLDQIEQQKTEVSLHKRHSDTTSKECQDIKWRNQMQLQEVEKRIVEELSHLRSDFEGQKTDLEQFYRNQLHVLHQKQARELESQLHRGLEDSTRTFLEQCQELCQQQEDNLQTVYKKQQSELKTYVKSQVIEERRIQQQAQKQNKEDLQQQIQQEMSKIQAQQREAASVTLKNPWNDNHFVPKPIQDQLDALHKRHMDEMKRLKQEIRKDEEAKENRDEYSESRNGVGYTQSSEPFARHNFDLPIQRQSAELQFRNRVGGNQSCYSGRNPPFVSPPSRSDLRWSSRTLFSKANYPSPVATVLPQRNESQVPQEKMKSLPTKSWDHGLVTRKVGNEGCTVKEQQKAEVLPQRRSQRLSGQKNPAIHEDQTVPSMQMFRNTSSCTSKKSVYDFDDEEGSPCVRPINDASYGMLTRNKNKWNRSYEDSVVKRRWSSPDSEDSKNSSPSLSVTEVVIRRKMHCEKKTPDTACLVSEHEEKNSFVNVGRESSQGDFLSKPNLLFSKCEEDQNSQLMQNSRGQNRSGTKRKLYDSTMDTQVLEITQSIRRQLQKKRLH